VLKPPDESEMLSRPEPKPTDKSTGEIESEGVTGYIDPIDTPTPQPKASSPTILDTLHKEEINETNTIHIFGLEITNDLPIYIYLAVATIVVIISLTILLIGNRVNLLMIIFEALLVIMSMAIVKLVVKLKLGKSDWGYYMLVSFIFLIALGAIGYFDNKQQYINSLRNQYGCTLSRYTNFKDDVAYVECMAAVVTGKVIGRNNVSVKCEPGTDTTISEIIIPESHGWVWLGSNESSIKWNVCESFYSWLRSDRKRISNTQGWALLVIIHEAIHIGGEHDEKETSYKSAVVYEDIVTSFGISHDEAKRYIEYFKKEVNPRQPPEYRVDWATRDL
jgi:hypothetical protein